MTETYNGYWNPLTGDTKEKVQDVYHKYPVGNQVGILNEPLSGVYQVRVISDVVQPKAGSK